VVEYAEVYRRILPHADAGDLLRRWARGEINIVTVTSNESLHNLYELVGKLGREWLRKTPLVVISERMVQLAKELGIQSEIQVADKADDEAMVQAVRQLAEAIQTGK
jgi:uroporphyrinogen-III synthase